MNSTTSSLRRLVAVLAVAGVVAGACGSSALDGRADEPLGGGGPDLELLDGLGGDACRSLDEVRRLGERYDEVADAELLEAVRTAEDDPDVDRDELAIEALRETLIELDPVAVDLLDAYRDAARAAPDVADDLELLADFTEVIVDSWGELLEGPDADPEALLATIFARDEEDLFEAWVAMGRVNAFTVDECGFELSPDA